MSALTDEQKIKRVARAIAEWNGLPEGYNIGHLVDARAAIAEMEKIRAEEAPTDYYTVHEGPAGADGGYRVRHIGDHR